MKRLIIPVLACLALAGCVENNGLSTGEYAKEYLEMWMAKWNKDNGKDIKPTSLGLYILEDIPGTGEVRHPDSIWIYANITIRSLSGKISTNNYADIAKQLGTYDPSYCYTPAYSVTGEGYSYAGLDAMLDGMKLGGTRRAIIPAWMLTTSRYSSMQGYIDACTSSSHLDYTITLTDQSSDIYRHQSERIKAYMEANYPGAVHEPLIPDSDDYTDDGGFWYYSDVSSFNEAAERSAVESDMTINYTGWRLDGQVFDTTVEKTAIDAGIYNSSNSYTPQRVTFSSTWSDIQVNSSSYIDGFKAALYRMKYAGQKAVVAFASAYGYSSTAKSEALPAYTPLVFEIELIAADEED
ncbi:MAG: FKBP-type peptidyl-prolyl cis-trans isomerase [Bacteroidales bacterium]|nr:FKBP-type peptidyl-prolyl cis-trans isomerase [Bacteroidales bacterium]